jgi:hypothetical protein
MGFVNWKCKYIAKYNYAEYNYAEIVFDINSEMFATVLIP